MNVNRGQLPTKQLSDSNWGAFDHASHAPRLLSDNYYMRVGNFGSHDIDGQTAKF